MIPTSLLFSYTRATVEAPGMGMIVFGMPGRRDSARVQLMASCAGVQHLCAAIASTLSTSRGTLVSKLPSWKRGRSKESSGESTGVSASFFLPPARQHPPAERRGGDQRDVVLGAGGCDAVV